MGAFPAGVSGGCRGAVEPMVISTRRAWTAMAGFFEEMRLRGNEGRTMIEVGKPLAPA